MVTKQTKSEELMAQPAAAGPIAIPEHLRKYAGQGREHILPEDVVIPRLALAQGLSPQLDPDKAEYIPGLKMGDAFNTLTGRIYGREPVAVAVIRVEPPRAMQFDEGNRSQVLDWDVPLTDPRCQFGPDGEPPVAVRFHDFIVCLLPGGPIREPEVAALSFKSKGIRAAKRLKGLLQVQAALPLFMPRFRLSPVKQTNDKGTWADFRVENAGVTADVATLDRLAALYESFRGRKVEIHEPTGSEQVDEDTSFNPNEM